MLDERELEDAVEFHGHLCFGLCVGLASSKLAMIRLGVEKAEGEEMIVTAENNSCAVDAIQVYAGATLGRGNLLVRNWGKHAYTFSLRSNKKSVRVSLKYAVFSGINNSEARIEKLLKSEDEEVFNVEDVYVELSPPAKIVSSVQCTNCKEPVMKTKTVERSGKVYCLPCYEKVYIQPSG